MNLTKEKQLYSNKKYILRFRGNVFHLRLSFLRVLSAADMLGDREIGEIRRINAALMKLLMPVSYVFAYLRPPEYKAGLLAEILNILSQGDGDNSESILSFTQDKALIYSAFRSAYDIDLSREDIAWHIFLWLLSGLPEQTRLFRVMAVRAAEIPPPDSYNKEERERLIALKNAFSLKKGDCRGNNHENYENGLEKLFSALCGISAADKRKE